MSLGFHMGGSSFQIPEPIALVPSMTSNTTPSGQVSRSSVYDSSYEGWRAFDGSRSSNGWAPAENTNSWIQYYFAGEDVRVTKLLIYNHTQGGNATTVYFTLYAGNSSDSMSPITQQITLSTPYHVDAFCDIDNRNFYKYYRLYFPAQGRPFTFGQGWKFQMYGKKQ